MGAHVYEKNKVQKSLKKTLHFEDWEGPKERLVIEQLYFKVSKLLADAGDPQLPGISAYDAIYRMPSLYSACELRDYISEFGRF